MVFPTDQFADHPLLAASITGCRSFHLAAVKSTLATSLVLISTIPVVRLVVLISRSGWLLATGWQGSVVGLSFLAGTIVQGLVALNHPSYVPQRWHGTLLVIAVVTFCIFFNTSFARKLPLVEGCLVVIHILGLFAIMIPLWILAPRNDAYTALLHFTNGGNWDTMGVAFMIGLLTSLGSMLGFDCAVHMGEFVPYILQKDRS